MGDGVSNATKRALVQSGEYRPEDFRPSTPAPAAAPTHAPSGDPTRRMPQAQYDAEVAKKKAIMEQKYLTYKLRKKR